MSALREKLDAAPNRHTKVAIVLASTVTWGRARRFWETHPKFTIGTVVTSWVGCITYFVYTEYQEEQHAKRAALVGMSDELLHRAHLKGAISDKMYHDELVARSH